MQLTFFQVFPYFCLKSQRLVLTCCTLYSILGQKGFHLKWKWFLRNSLQCVSGACCRVTVVHGCANLVWRFGYCREVMEGWARLQLSLGLCPHILSAPTVALGLSIRKSAWWVLNLVNTAFDFRAASVAVGEIYLLWSELQVKWHPQGSCLHLLKWNFILQLSLPAWAELLLSICFNIRKK